MCGIAGIFYRDGLRSVDPAQLAAMATAIAHRGPDGEGFFHAPGIGLAHRRLAIIDLAQGQQPLGNEDGSVQVVFNGEIYNYRALRERLLARGHRFSTQSDTEVLVHLYEEEGDELVHALRGMFAFALWDSRRRRLLLARDRLGIKPLYYFVDSTQLLFCSEPKGILASGSVPREVAPAALGEYLSYGFVGGERSIFRGVNKLLPGHTLALAAGDAPAITRRYWQLPSPAKADTSETDWREAVRAKVEESVDAHLVADVPVGSFLSGGLDSGVITALAAQRTSGPLHTFSIGFQEAAFNELPAARLVAQRYGTRHSEELVTADAAEVLDDLCWYCDEPFADSSLVPTYRVAQLAAREVKVVLSGDGGDEAFGGYRRYVHDLWEHSLRQRIPSWLRRGVLGPLAMVWPTSDWLPRVLRAKSLLANVSRELPAAYARTLATCRSPWLERLLVPEVLDAYDDALAQRVQRAFDSAAHAPLPGMIAADVVTLLPDDYLVKVDRASMACGLEVRPPLLDHELLELSVRIPASLKIRRGETKAIFRDACGDLLPPELLTLPKQGFEIPVDHWMRGALGDRLAAMVLEQPSPLADWLQLAQVRALLQAHRAQRVRGGQILWSVLVLALWAQRHLVTSTSPVLQGVPS
jgi:asparagine synthase (glutamine-hydrolysing)